MDHEVFDISSDDEEEEEERGCLLSNEDSDEVVVVGEVFGDASSSSVCQKQSSSNSLEDDDDDDDECLILDGDPDKPVEVANDGGSGGSDELQVVSEKGQIACRDYPHPRHLCARFPFKTNPHEKHCDLCHCYVCDAPAPCIYWGTGTSNGDHCHSSDKEEAWKLQRKWIKHGKTAPLPVPKLPVEPLLQVPKLPVAPLVNKCIPPSLPQSLSIGSTLPNTLSMTNTLRGCSSTRRVVLPTTIINQRNQQHPGPTLGRNRLPHHGGNSSTSLSPGSTSITNNGIQREKGSGPFLSSHVNFKKVGPGRFTSSKNRYGPGSYENNSQLYSCMLQQQTNNQKPQPYSSVQSARSQDFFVGMNSEQNACHGSFQPTLNDNFLGSQSQNALQPQVYSQPILPSSQNQYTQVPGNSAPNMINQNLANFGLNWFNDSVQSNAPSEVNSQLSNVQPTSGPSPVHQLSNMQPISEPSPLMEPIPQIHGLTDLTTNLPSADFDLDCWINSLEHHPGLETRENNIESELGFVPSETEMADAAVMLLFDFENQ